VNRAVALFKNKEIEIVMCEIAQSAVDDFESEVERLRYNDAFIAFLDTRAKEPKIPIEEARKRLLETD